MVPTAIAFLDWQFREFCRFILPDSGRDSPLPEGEAIHRRISMQRRTLTLAVCFGVALVLGSVPALAQYQLTNLVSNQVGAAKHTDPLVVNAWGLAYGPGSPFWIADNGSGWSTLYNGVGKAKSLRVLIPSVVNGPGSPTGIVFNG